MGSESVIEALQCESTRGMEQKEATISRPMISVRHRELTNCNL